MHFMSLCMHLFRKLMIRGILLASGADLFLGKKITVEYNSNSREFGRVPVAHACGCVLEMPDSYASFIELRSEFDKILQSKVWIMDIV